MRSLLSSSSLWSSSSWRKLASSANLLSSLYSVFQVSLFSFCPHVYWLDSLHSLSQFPSLFCSCCYLLLRDQLVNLTTSGCLILARILQVKVYLFCPSCVSISQSLIRLLVFFLIHPSLVRTFYPSSSPSLSSISRWDCSFSFSSSQSQFHRCRRCCLDYRSLPTCYLFINGCSVLAACDIITRRRGRRRHLSFPSNAISIIFSLSAFKHTV